MHVISRKKLLDFGKVHPEAEIALDNWYRIMKKSRFHSLPDLRKVFPSADWVGGFMVFNIGGNKVRLIALIFYKTQKLFIRHVLTHTEYDQGKWKE